MRSDIAPAGTVENHVRHIHNRSGPPCLPLGTPVELEVIFEVSV